MTFLNHILRPMTKLIMFATVIALRATQIIGIGVGELNQNKLNWLIFTTVNSINQFLFLLYVCALDFFVLLTHILFLRS